MYPCNNLVFSRLTRLGRKEKQGVNIVSTSDWTFTSLVTQKSPYNSSDTALLLKWYTRALEALARDPCTEVQTCQISNKTDIVEVMELGRGRQVEVP